jgi:hypothetical protein
MPARVTFRVNTLSRHHMKRRFRVKVVGLARTRVDHTGAGGYDQRLVCYSEEFEVVSARCVMARRLADGSVPK